MVSTKSASRLKARLSCKLHSLTRSYKSPSITPLAQASKHIKAANTRRCNDENTFISTLRAVSLRNLTKAFPGHSRGFHTVPDLPKVPAQTRKIIRVSKLNFGVFDPNSSPSLPPAAIRATQVTSGPTALGDLTLGLGFAGLSGAGIADDPTATLTAKTVVQPFSNTQESTANASVTERSLYSQEGWIEVTRDIAGGTGDTGMQPSGSITTLESLESELFRSEDWSHDSEATPSIDTVTGTWNAADLTTSSINEESFLRIAEVELGW